MWSWKWAQIGWNVPVISNSCSCLWWSSSGLWLLVCLLHEIKAPRQSVISSGNIIWFNVDWSNQISTPAQHFPICIQVAKGVTPWYKLLLLDHTWANHFLFQLRVELRIHFVQQRWDSAKEVVPWFHSKTRVCLEKATLLLFLFCCWFAKAVFLFSC